MGITTESVTPMERTRLRATAVQYVIGSTCSNTSMNLGQRESIINRARRKKKPSSSTKGTNNGKAATYRSYCPFCPPNHTDPERSSSVSAVKGSYMVTGPCKHSWMVGGASRATNPGTGEADGNDDNSPRAA